MALNGRDPTSLSRANGAYLVVDRLLSGWRLKKEKEKQGGRDLAW